MASPHHQEEEEEDSEEICDSCLKPFNSDELVKCPSACEEMGPGKPPYYKQFCEECCTDIDDYEGCQEDFDECERARMLFGKRLNVLAKENSMEQSNKHAHMYFDKFNIYCISTYHNSPENVSNDKFCQSEQWNFFRGEDYLLAKTEHRQTAYRVEALDEVKKILDQLHLLGSNYRVLTKSRVLIVDEYPAWSAIAPLIETGDGASMLFAEERQKFTDRTTEGAAFFEIQPQKDDLAILRPSKLVIDWTKIDDKKFQELCRDLLQTLPGVKRVSITGGHTEWGQDIEMLETVRDLTGDTERRWSIQCKHIQSRDLLKSDLAVSSFEAFLKFDYDVYCVMTSALVSPTCRMMLNMIQNDKRLRVKCEVFDKKKLEDLVRARPEVFVTYFK